MAEAAAAMVVVMATVVATEVMVDHKKHKNIIVKVSC
jgi:hypothetical protein